MTAIQRIGLPRPIAALLAAAALLVAMIATPAGAQERFSGLTGTVTDASGAVLPGATVAITNKETGKVFTAVTGADGVYRVLDLEPGRYSVKVELSGFATTEFPDVNLFLGKTITVDSSLKIGGVTEAVSVTAESPLIDTRNTTIAHNVSAEEFERIPKGRTFQNLALASPSVNAGEVEGGIQVNGASGSENSFTVDGVVTNSLINGASRQDAVFEYLQEVQVKTGGISAEYGGALGGVISAVTKSGGNSYRGEAHYYFTGAATSAAPVERLVLNPADDITVNYFQDVKQPNNRHDIGGSLGGPILRDKLFFFGSWAPRYVRRRNDYIFAGGETGTIDQKQTINSAFGKVNYDPSNRLRTSFSILWTPTTSEGTLPAYNGAAPNTISSSKASNENQKMRGFEIPQISYSGTLDFTLEQLVAAERPRRHVRRQLPRHRRPAHQQRRATRPATSADAALGYPIPGQPARRRRVPEHLARAVVARGSHQARLSARWTTSRRSPPAATTTSRPASASSTRPTRSTTPTLVAATCSCGGIARSRARRPASPTVAPYGYYEVNDFGTRGEASADILSLYVQDQWSINNLTLNLGLRTEREVIPSFRTGHQGRGVQVQLRRQAGAAPRPQLRRARRRPLQGVRQLGPLLRLDQVRAVARRVRRRHLARAVPLARYHRRLLAVGHQPAGAQPVDAGRGQFP